MKTDVRVSEDEGEFKLSNRLMKAYVNKSSGRLVGLKYGRLQFLAPKTRRSRISGGYWTISTVHKSKWRTIESRVVQFPCPETERVIVSCVQVLSDDAGYDVLEADFRYSLGASDSTLSVWVTLRHPAAYGALDINIGRYALKLNPELFDFLAIDHNRNTTMPSSEDWRMGQVLRPREARLLKTGIKAGEVEHKYDYSAVLFDTPAYGWASSSARVGVWMINPSFEYVAGGPTKVELTGHLDDSDTGYPTLVNVWKGTHFGGTSLVVAGGEEWAKTVGPFHIYINSDKEVKDLWNDATQRAKKERYIWPYDWAADGVYLARAERGAVSGRILVDEQPVKEVGPPLVGLVAAQYRPGPVGAAGPGTDWQAEGKRCQFWQRADQDGGFCLSNVLPGVYNLHSITDGVLGEFIYENVTVCGGHSHQLGTHVWVPRRLGEQLWEIGYPNRTASKYRHGDSYWRWGLWRRYPDEFPGGVNFSIGMSDWRKDWNYAQPAQIKDGRAIPTIWSIYFNVNQVYRGTVHLRLAFAGAKAPGDGIQVGINGSMIGWTGKLPDSGVMHRDGIRGYWCEKVVSFCSSYLNVGRNCLTLHLHGKKWYHGVLYDYIRMEIQKYELCLC